MAGTSRTSLLKLYLYLICQKGVAFPDALEGAAISGRTSPGRPELPPTVSAAAELHHRFTFLACRALTVDHSVLGEKCGRRVFISDQVTIQLPGPWEFVHPLTLDQLS